MNKFLSIWLLVATIFLGSCVTTSTDEQPYDKTRLPETRQTLIDDVKMINESNAKISTNATTISKTTKEPETRKLSDAIITETQNLKLVVKDIVDSTNEIAIAIKAGLEAKEKMEQLEKEKDDLLTSQRKWTNIALGGIIVTCVILGGICAFLFFSGAKTLAMSIGAGAAVSAGGAITVMSQWDNIAFIGYGFIVLFVLVILYAVFAAIKKQFDDKKKIETEKQTLKQGLKETIATAEVAKTYLSESDKKEVFGDDGLANKIQSESTKQLVEKEKGPGI